MKTSLASLIKETGGKYDWSAYENIKVASLDALINDANPLFQDPLFDYHISAAVFSSLAHLPDVFLVRREQEYVLARRVEEVFMTEDNQTIDEAFLSSADIIYIEETPKKLSANHLLETVVGFFPRINFWLLCSAPFVLIPAFYANLFNTRMIYNDGAYTFVFVSFCFTLLWSVDYLLKRFVKHYHLIGVDVSALKLEKYFFSLLPFSKLDDNLIKIRILEANRKIIWDNLAAIAADIASFLLVFFVLTFILGISSLYLLLFYVFMFFLLVGMRYWNYRIYIKHEVAQQDILTERIAICRNHRQLRFLDYNSSFSGFENACKKIFRSDKQVAKFNFNWDELARYGWFMASFMLFFVVFFESKIDVALFTVLIALLVLNGRVAASVSSIVTRGFYALVATYHIKESLTPLIENISENCYIRGLKINSVDSLAVKNVTLMVGENVLLRNIDMEFKQGKTYGIYGAVGTGKSTLVKALFNLHEEYTGNISYNGIYEAKTIDRHCFADHVCYLDIHSDFLKGSIFHNFYIRGVRDKARIVSLCRAIFHTMAVDYEFVFKTDVTMIPMSSGQKRKLMLYMSISHEKSLIVLDEALVNLSIDDVVAARNYIAEVCPQAIVVIVSHDRSILNLLPNVYQIEAGAVKTLKSDVVKIGQK